MKKIVFPIVALLALAFSASAQDTIDISIMHSNYYHPEEWPKDLEVNQFGTVSYFGPDGGGEFGVKYEIDSSLTIYGIVGVVTEDCVSCDTDYSHSFEFLRLYESVHLSTNIDTLRCIAQSKIHARTTPVSYYLRICTYTPVSNCVKPVYERYFDSAVVVSDSFYIGMTQFIPRQNIFNEGDPHNYARLGAFQIGIGNGYSQKLIVYWQNPPSSVSPTPYWATGFNDDYLLILPILTPPDSNYVWDTTVVAGDTIAMGDTIIVCDTIIIGSDTIIQYDTILGIDDHGMLGRLTGVMPNPAAETAKVVSSFGLSRVEAYNLAGEKVDDLHLPSPSLSATLDVRRWPVGAYILHIHTPQGVATKKLTVVR